MTLSTHFQHLQFEDRLTIASLWPQLQGWGGQIARVPYRPLGTISRELRCNPAPDGRDYCSQMAQGRRQGARMWRKLDEGSPLWDAFRTSLRRY